MSTIDEATLLAYLRCHYRVLEAPPFTLRIGERSAALAALFERSGCDCAAFLTAWNPRGERHEVAANQAGGAGAADPAALGGIAAAHLPGSRPCRSDARGAATGCRRSLPTEPL